MNRNIVLLFLPLLLSCNIWDNIFSKPRGIPTIIFHDEFSATFNTTQNQTQYKIRIDYNLPQLRANAELYTQLDVIMNKIEMQVAQMEINFNSNLLVVKTPISCNNYELGYNFSLPKNEVSSKVLGSYLQILFEFIKKEGSYFVFKFNPNLIGSMEEQNIPDVLVYTDQSGEIRKITVNQQPIEYQWKSVIKKIACKNAVQKLSQDKDLKRMLDALRG